MCLESWWCWHLLGVLLLLLLHLLGVLVVLRLLHLLGVLVLLLLLHLFGVLVVLLLLLGVLVVLLLLHLFGVLVVLASAWSPRAAAAFAASASGERQLPSGLASATSDVSSAVASGTTVAALLS